LLTQFFCKTKEKAVGFRVIERVKNKHI